MSQATFFLVKSYFFLMLGWLKIISDELDYKKNIAS